MRVLLTALLTALLLLPCIAAADTAQDITAECIINNREYNEHAPEDHRDGNYGSYYTGSSLTFVAPQGKQIGAVVLRWRDLTPPTVILKTGEKDKWVEIKRAEPDYAAQ